ncbi:hypothetical protein GTY65_23130 [Streptomyces sp. SID8379]|uniref:hypothetical protein n=1 Tax=unclassified Streptomyces TaxID=2593676 RepID=UPI000377676D|nr:MULTISPECIES: hypothetical protein [unclassified Streptomyces]MYW66939.1 hypothetical protein [Streptomyces sp. SID8379]
METTGVWLVVGLFWGLLVWAVTDLSWPVTLGSGGAWGMVSGLLFCAWLRPRIRAERR